MPRTVKLTSADARAWRENRAQWVSPKGFVLRAVTPEEEKAVFPALEQVKRFKQSGHCSVQAIYKTADPATGAVREQPVPMEVMVRVTKTGRDANSFLYDLFVNGNRYVKGRDVLRSRILEKHGEAILQGPNGKQICVLRDPTVNRPTFAESQRSAPSPERCHCKGFKDNPDVGRHHIACEWNMKAAPHERALPIQRDGIQRGMMDLATPIPSMRFDAPDVGRSPNIPTTPVLRTSNGMEIHAASGSQMLHGGVASMAVPQVISGPGYSFPQSAGPVAPPGAEEGFGFGVSGFGQNGSGSGSEPRPNTQNPLRTAPPAPPGIQVAQTPRAQVAALVSPKDCENDCRGISSGTKGWEWPAGRKPENNQHHPLCKHEGAWRYHVTGQRRWMLYDMDRHVELREATADERAKAEVELGRSGIRSVQVGEGLYAVVEAGTSPLAASPSSRMGGTNLTGTRMRPTPDQAALRPADSQGAGVAPTVLNRPALPLPPPPPADEALEPKAASEMSIEELQALLLARQREAAPIEQYEERESLMDEGPGFDEGEPSWGEQAEATEAEADSQQQTADSFGGNGSGSGSDLAPYSLHPIPSSSPLPPGAFISGELPGLRDELGLVGLQQKPSTIEAGPVRVVDPEPFVDPLEERGPEVRFQPVSVVPTAGVGAGG